MIHRNHGVIQIRHDDQRSKHYQRGDEDTECQGQDIVRLIGCTGNLQEERHVHAHLRNRQYRKQNRYGGRTDSVTTEKSLTTYALEGIYKF